MSEAMQSAVADVAPEEPSISLGYHPALDGLRGLALLAIIVYHSQVGWAPGAFLSVSTFFTLSGFLITGLLLVEHRRTNRISLGGFWSRRLRRLMPAATAAVIAIVFATWIFGDSTQLARMRGDALASLGYVANWWFIGQGDQYGASFASPSPFTHFWTLAIEEQFYVVLPALVTVVLAVSRGSRRALAWVFGAIVALSMARAFILLSRQVSFDRLYWGTDIRVVEFISGSYLALAWSYRPNPYSGRARRMVNRVGAVALAAMLVLWVTANFHNGAVYGGGLAAYSLLTLAVILAAIQPGSLVQRVLAFRPLAWIGVVSYGAYLVHFPILTFIAGNTRLGAPARLFISVPITMGIAGASARFLERPIRTRRRLAGSRAWIAPPVALSVAAASILVVTAIASPTIAADPFAGVPEIFDADLEKLALVVGDSRAPRVAVFGDSTALMTGLGLLEYSIDHPERIVTEPGASELGCALLPGVTRIVQGRLQETPSNCEAWFDDWNAAVSTHPVDVAVVQFGPFDVRDQQLEQNGSFLTIGEDDELDDALRGALQERVDLLLQHSGTVALLSSPDIDVGRIDGRSTTDDFPESDPARMERLREIFDEVAANTPGVVVIDLAGWLAARPDEHKLRPDGVHFTPSTTGKVAEWLVPELLRLHQERTGNPETLVPLG
jgi:peptidoglycan/LPS O-acetylase OafA/YrhL